MSTQKIDMAIRYGQQPQPNATKTKHLLTQKHKTLNYYQTTRTNYGISTNRSHIHSQKTWAGFFIKLFSLDM